MVERVQCNFNCVGKSWEYKCCIACNHNRGHFKKGEHLEKSRQQYWTDEQGFKKVGGGCRLPVELRSDVCLAYWCNKDKNYGVD